MNITIHFTEFICPKTFKLVFLNFPSNHIICKYAVSSFLIVISHFVFFITLFRTFKTLCSDSNNNRNTFYFFAFLKIEVWLIFNVMLVPGVEKSDSVIQIYILFFIFFSTMVYHRILI